MVIESKTILNNKLSSKKTFSPELKDLYRLYKFIILNNRTTIMEFGSGWSSLIFNLALNDLKKNLKKKTSTKKNLFELFILENNKKYLSISKIELKIIITSLK